MTKKYILEEGKIIVNESFSAEMVLKQLGGNKFIAMTGAKEFVQHKNYIRFKLPSRFAKDGINFVKITLNSKDLYDMEFGKVRGLNYKVIKTESDVHGDMLKRVFKAVTGLDTHL